LLDGERAFTYTVNILIRGQGLTLSDGRKGQSLSTITNKTMSKFILEKNIKSELKRINDVIDLKIIRGIPYRREALRHRFLLYRLVDLHRLSKFHSNWFQRSVNVVATFLL